MSVFRGAVVGNVRSVSACNKPAMVGQQGNVMPSRMT